MEFKEFFINCGGFTLKHRIYKNGDCFQLHQEKFICNLLTGDNIDKQSKWLIRELNNHYNTAFKSKVV